MEMFKGSSDLLAKCLRQTLNCPYLTALNGCDSTWRQRGACGIEATVVEFLSYSRVKDCFPSEVPTGAVVPTCWAVVEEVTGGPRFEEMLLGDL